MHFAIFAAASLMHPRLFRIEFSFGLKTDSLGDRPLSLGLHALNPRKLHYQTYEPPDAMLKRDDVAFGYKFITGNVGRVGKKITLPHYMSMFV